MRLLLDTQAFIWATSGDARLGVMADLAIRRADSVLISIATLWEMAIKVGNGRLDFPMADITGIMERMRFGLLQIMPEHAVAVSALPPIHRDPFDRMLIAQAQLDSLLLVTSDRIIGQYDVPVVDAAR